MGQRIVGRVLLLSSDNGIYGSVMLLPLNDIQRDRLDLEEMIYGTFVCEACVFVLYIHRLIQKKILTEVS